MSSKLVLCSHFLSALPVLSCQISYAFFSLLGRKQEDCTPMVRRHRLAETFVQCTCVENSWSRDTPYLGRTLCVSWDSQLQVTSTQIVTQKKKYIWRLQRKYIGGIFCNSREVSYFKIHWNPEKISSLLFREINHTLSYCKLISFMC